MKIWQYDPLSSSLTLIVAMCFFVGYVKIIINITGHEPQKQKIVSTANNMNY
jgi:hypothetical protein